MLVEEYTEHVYKKASFALGLLRRVRDLVHTEALSNIHKVLVLHNLDYVFVAWDGLDKGLSTKLRKIQNRATRMITRSSYDIRSSDILAGLRWETLAKRR